jgi:hypothetical protein
MKRTFTNAKKRLKTTQSSGMTNRKDGFALQERIKKIKIASFLQPMV